MDGYMLKIIMYVFAKKKNYLRDMIVKLRYPWELLPCEDKVQCLLFENYLLNPLIHKCVLT